MAHMINQRWTGMTLSLDEICALPRDRVSDPEAMRSFANGIRIRPEVLSDARWQIPPSLGRQHADIYARLILEGLPQLYSVDHLTSLGRRFSLFLPGVMGFTLTVVSHRVVIMTGLPLKRLSDAVIVQLSLAPDIFLAFWNGMLLAASEAALSGVHRQPEIGPSSALSPRSDR